MTKDLLDGNVIEMEVKREKVQMKPPTDMFHLQLSNFISYFGVDETDPLIPLLQLHYRS